jgi:hypothetical protein
VLVRVVLVSVKDAAALLPEPMVIVGASFVPVIVMVMV